MNIMCIGQTWCADEFRKKGHRVTTVGKHKHFDIQLPPSIIPLPQVVDSLPAGNYPDALIYFDDSSPIPFTHFFETNIPSLFYSVDTHHHYALHRIIGSGFSHICFAQKDYESKLTVAHRPMTWIPLWASSTFAPKKEKSIEVCFIGTLNRLLNPERVDFFERLQKKRPITCVSGAIGDYYPKSKIVINQTVKGDLNFRVFEAMGSGAMLLTETSGNGLFNLFQEGTHLATYPKNDTSIAIEQMEYYLADEDRRSTIAANGYKEIMDCHLASHRATSFLAILESLSAPPKAYSAIIDGINCTAHGDGCVLTRKDVAAKFYAIALLRFSDALERQEELSYDVASLISGVCLRFDFITGENHGLRLIKKLRNKAPQFEVPHYIYARALANKGEFAKAMEILNCTDDESLNITLCKIDKLVESLAKPL